MHPENTQGTQEHEMAPLWQSSSSQLPGMSVPSRAREGLLEFPGTSRGLWGRQD